MNPTDLPNVLPTGPDIDAAKDYGQAFAEMYIAEVKSITEAFKALDVGLQQTIVGLYIQLRFR